MRMRVDHHPVLGKQTDRKQVTIFFNGKPYDAYEGDTIASAMMAQGVYALRQHEVSGNARGVYCNIGHCYECRVKVEDRKVVRACLTTVYHGMEIDSLSGFSEGNE
ncbi:(2Fe-2S)-binding protein [Oceanobacillus piezotolerans]|uniref:(2Fe-2S)-binding protein n=1 Tax=Oceanobacillus piezotolerans TaxID=2448030 RepID=A0A498D4K8_9BACI|nr:(2Fe-2S)-binding protein [Oceanobacillus piezotolerans]RLL43815.1 (2Fe-2S)-binding protein [Oceanobacillus piezotolerans]